MSQCENSPLRGELHQQEPLTEYTSWRVGGPAERLYKPADVGDLAAFIAQLPTDEPLTWLGLGSNVLVRDGGIAGTVICTQGALKELIQVEPNLIRAEAGVSAAKVARFCARLNLGDVAFLAGIPGTMGGALAMNAGCFKGETWDVVEAVEVITRAGERKIRQASDYTVGYRHVEGPQEEWFVAAYLRLQAIPAIESLDKIRVLLQRRADTQPTHLPSGGSVFRNPPSDHAARLIEVAGLKGYRIGGAAVSEKHANFIVNDTSATAADIESIIKHVAAVVARVHGVQLITEVHILGENK
jgi:UDP-N-acetylmuramate dehydrogenase